MRVFISHSGEERWIAGQIAAELTRVGAQPYLSEDHMRTGAVIADTIWSEINASDDVLVLLTPVSIDRRWVAMEIGAALALGKKVRLFCLHLKPEEVPLEFSRGRLARHLNDIKVYFDEVRSDIGRAEFVEERVNVVKSLEVKDAPAEELATSQIAQSPAPGRNNDVSAEVVRRVLEALKTKRDDDDKS